MTRPFAVHSGHVTPGARTALLVLAFGLLLLAQGWRAVRQHGKSSPSATTAAPHAVHQILAPVEESPPGKQAGILPAKTPLNTPKEPNP